MYPVVNQTTAHANAPSPSRQSQKDQPEHPNVLSCEPTGAASPEQTRLFAYQTTSGSGC